MSKWRRDGAAVLGRDRRLWRHLATPARQHGRQLMAEALSSDAVEEEVDGVVDETEQVRDGLDVSVVLVIVLPVRLADQQDNTRRHADEERERDPEAHERRLAETGSGISTSGSGLGGGRFAHALSLDEDVNDAAVEDEDEDERQGCDESEDDPWSDVLQEDVILAL